MTWRRGALILGGIGLLLQLVPSRRDNPPVTSPVDAPPGTRGILERACCDCHSNETRWPWYSRVAPVSWFTAFHVRKGRKALNFSEWPTFDFELQDLIFGDIRDEISRGKMPLKSYRLLHPEARLSETERRLLLAWAGADDEAGAGPTGPPLE